MGAGPDVRWDGGRQSRTDTAPRADRPCPAGPRARSVRGGSRPGVFHARARASGPWPGSRPEFQARGASGPWHGSGAGGGSGPVAREPPGAFHTRARLPDRGQGAARGFRPVGGRYGFRARGQRATRGFRPMGGRASALMAGEPPSFSGPYPGRGTSLAAPGSRPGLLAVREGPGPARRGTGSTGRLSSRASAGQIRGTAAAARRRPGHKPSRDHLQ